jgi:hypothetical protein
MVRESCPILSSRVLFRRSSILSIDSDQTDWLIIRSITMLQKTLLLICIVCAIVLVGCSKSATSTNSPGATTANANKAATSTTPTTTVATAGHKIGVPECDEFIAAYDACVSSKVPEVARAQYKATIAQWRSSWSKLAENPQTKPTLAAACKQSAEQARVSMKTYGCTF